MSNCHIAVVIPCYNEAKAIRKVITDFRAALPQATIYVYDNNSHDNTAAEVRVTDAILRSENLQGKGNVVRRMFADVDADIYVMVDGDATYDSASAPELIKTMLQGPYDMVNASRISQEKSAYRFGHTFGNKLLTTIVAKIFGKRFNDMLSGYRIFSRRFVKSFPCHSSGFEIETELTVHALSLQMPIIEIETPYFSRPEGSFSKLSTYKDGFRILRMIFNLVRKERPLLFFGSIGLFFIILSLFIGSPVVVEYLQTGLVPRLPSAVLSASIMLLAFLSITCGLILDTVTRGRQEAKRLAYLNHPAVGNEIS
jgi:glycosyltransferase involved in cell wall biosynthesis